MSIWQWFNFVHTYIAMQSIHIKTYLLFVEYLTNNYIAWFALMEMKWKQNMNAACSIVCEYQ